MPSNGTLAFVEAVRLTLAYCGAEVFDDPQKFVAYLYDMTDERSEEMRVLKNNCTAELLAPFRQANTMTSVDLKRAAATTQDYLAEECLINAETSRSIARGIAEGVARWRELTIAWDDFKKEPVPNPGPPRKTVRNRIATGVAALFLAGCVVAALSTLLPDGFVGRLFTHDTADREEGVWVCTIQQEQLSNGDVRSKFSRTFDTHGNELTRNYERTDEDGRSSSSSYTFGDYDSFGYPGWSRESSTWTEADGQMTSQDKSSVTYVNKMDSRGRLTSRTTSTERSSWYVSSGWDDELWHDDETTTYMYDGDNLVKRESQGVTTHGTYRSESTSVTEYDSYGNMTHDRTRLASDGEVFSLWDVSISYQLSGDGIPLTSKRIATSEYGDDTDLVITNRKYDERGEIVESVITEDGVTETTTFKNEYDENGNLVRVENLSDGSVTTYEYLYIEHPSFAVLHPGW